MTSDQVNEVLDVLVVGAGPTGLALALHLQRFGTRFRIVDRQLDRARESRAVVLQPRTLEVLAPVDATAEMAACGNAAVGVRVHRGRLVKTAKLFDIGIDDTAYPHLLFLSQSETERILAERLTAGRAEVERGSDLLDYVVEDDAVVCTVRHLDGAVETIRTRYLVGCDGAHSTVRTIAGIDFLGQTYPQTFILADVEVDGIDPDSVHIYMSGRGMLFFFPLGVPATWRMLSMRPSGDDRAPGDEITLAQVRSIARTHAGPDVHLRDPAWMTDFRLHCRSAAHYRAGRVFLCGDAAHIHSPAGGQGMNIGIQDSVNLAWKLAMVCSGAGDPALLDTYESERMPIGRAVLRFTDRAFRIATSANPMVRAFRAHVVARLVPLLLKSRFGRATAFRTIAELDVRYRHSALSTNGARFSGRGAVAGDRLPDGAVQRGSQLTTLHSALTGAAWHVLACGPADAWTDVSFAGLDGPSPALIRTYLLSRDPTIPRDPTTGVPAGPVVLSDVDGVLLGRLGAPTKQTTHVLVRPDGHIAYRGGGTDLRGLRQYLNRWLPGHSGAISK